jgi:flagellar biogenesis protein FliO
VIFSYLLTLFGVCGLAVGSLAVLRAAKGGGLSMGGTQPIRVVGRQAVGAGSTLMLVEVDGERMLIAVSRGGVSVIGSAKKRRSPEPVERQSGARTVLRQAQDCGSALFRATLRRAGERR